MNSNYHPIQIADLGYLAVPAPAIADVIGDRSRWSAWFPGLTLQLTEDRGPLGVRWIADGKVKGTSEIWLEEAAEGTFLHYFLHGEPTGKHSAAKLTMQYRLNFKNLMNELRSSLDGERPVGEDPHQWLQASPRPNNSL
ncbi:MAG TPA: polyketide cyclase / dehydrase and lipid transport [Corynebacteriales bacterium]|nr:polyketide cyclase / dehydrase and lipid transport [Mycobacteriales bacterium]